MLIALIVMGVTAQGAGLLNLPDPQAFNDQSALTVKHNLQSQKYQDFIHQLYRHDADNLKRVDDLFANADRLQDRSSGSSQADIDAVQPSYADYIRTQEQQPQQQPINYFGISQDSTKRYKRSAQGAIFRPLFVYRIFQERLLEREEERLRRRLCANRRRTSVHLKKQNNY